MPHKNLYIFLLVVIFFAAASFYVIQNRPQTVPVHTDGKLRVLTTFFPLYDFTRNVGGDKIQVDILFSQTPEVSSFTPQDIQKVNNVDLIIKNGAGLEPVVDSLIKSSDNKNVKIVDTSVGIPLVSEEEAVNPHIWLNPSYAIKQVEHIRGALITADPANAKAYQVNAETYIQSLNELDREILKGTAPLKKRKFVAFHPAFIYFAERYKLTQVATIEEFPGKEPSPQYLAQVIETIKQSGVSAIFSEPQFSPKVVQTIARDLGLEVKVLNPIETGDAAKDSYISLMRENLQTLEAVLH